MIPSHSKRLSLYHSSPLIILLTRVFGFLSERMMLPFIEYLKDKKNVRVKEGIVLYLNRKEKNEGDI